MFDFNKIYFFEEIFSQSEYENIKKEEEKSAWTFGAASLAEENLNFASNLEIQTKLPRKFWVKIHSNNNILKDIFYNKIKQLLGVDVTIFKITTNGQAHGQSGELHPDIKGHDNKNYMTMVYYTQKWNPLYGGHTIVYDFKNKVHSFLPTYNSCVIFNSRFKHVGLEPTIHCPGQRETLAVKFIIKE